MGGANSVKAKTLDVNLSALPEVSENTTWNNSTKTFAWSDTGYNSTELFVSDNYSAYSTLNFKTVAGTADHFRVIIKYGASDQVIITPIAAGNVSIKLTDYITSENLAKVTSIRLSGANDATGDIKVSRIYLEGPDYIKQTTVKVAPVGVTDIDGMAGEGDYTLDVSYPIIFVPETQIGGCIDDDTKSIDISSYDYILFHVSEVSDGAKAFLRVFVSTEKEESNIGNVHRVMLFPRPIADYATVADKDWTEEVAVTAPGTYVVKVSDYPWFRCVKNKAGWQGGSGTAKISLAYMGSGSTPAAPVDKVTRIGEEALTDANATWFDVTGLSESGITYNATNLNAIFDANSGELTNTNNVIVGGTCATLALTDGNYPFKAYDTFTATNVSYNREFKAGKKSTVCLPFALTPAEAAAAGKFYELSDVNDGNTGFIFTDVTSSGTTAYKPYIFEATENGTPFSAYSGKSIAATPTSFTGEAVEGYTLTGVLAGSSDVAADNEGKTVYGWSGNDGKEGDFVKVGTGVAINPFRAYVVYDGDGVSLARMAARFVSGSVTGINEVSETQNVLNPDRKYIENNNIVIVKNGVKFNAAGQLLK